MQLLDIIEMFLIGHCRIVDDGFIVELHQRIDDVARGIRVQLRLLRDDNGVKVLNVNALGGTLRGDLRLHDFPLFLIALADVEPLRLHMFDYHVDAVSGVVHYDFKFKVLGCGAHLFGFASVYENEAVRLLDAALDLFQRGQREPAGETNDILDFVVRLQIQQHRLGNDGEYIDVALAFALIARYLLLLFAWKHAARRRILMPNVHVILQAQVKLADHGCRLKGRSVFDHVCDELRDLLDDIYQGHRGTPVFLLARDQV